MFRYGNTNWIIVSASEHNLPNFHIFNIVLPLDSNNHDNGDQKQRVIIILNSEQNWLLQPD